MIHFNITDIGLMSETVSPPLYYYVADLSYRSKIGIGISQAFKGNFLQYHVECEQPHVCGNSPTSIVTAPPAAQIHQIDLVDKMRATGTRLVFQFKEWVVLVDSLSICTGIQSSPDWSSTYSALLVDLGDYFLENIVYALWVQEKFGGELEHDFWVVQASNSTNGQLVLVVFEVFEMSSNIDLNLLDLSPIIVTNLVAPVQEMKYSPQWNLLAYSTTPSTGIENLVEVYELKWDASRHSPYVLKMGQGSSFVYQVSPFLVQSFEFHTQMPILILGIKDNGLLAVHVFTLQIVFAVDIINLLNQ